MSNEETSEKGCDKTTQQNNKTTRARTPAKKRRVNRRTQEITNGDRKRVAAMRKRLEAEQHDREADNDFLNPDGVTIYTIGAVKMERNRGQPRAFPTPQDLQDAAEEYFAWVAAKPLYSAKVVKDEDGDNKLMRVPHMHMATLEGLAVFSGTHTQIINSYRNLANYSGAIRFIDETIATVNLAGAAAGLLKENIVSRYLGLAERTQIDANVNVQALDVDKLARSVALTMAMAQKAAEARSHAVDAETITHEIAHAEQAPTLPGDLETAAVPPLNGVQQHDDEPTEPPRPRRRPTVAPKSTKT